MSLLTKYTTSSMASLLDDIYNLSSFPKPRTSLRSRFIPSTDTQGRLEVELAGYESNEIEVYTEDTSLVVSAKKADGSRKYHHSWYLAENERVDKVSYKNGLLEVEISVIQPESSKKKVYKIT